MLRDGISINGVYIYIYSKYSVYCMNNIYNIYSRYSIAYSIHVNMCKYNHQPTGVSNTAQMMQWGISMGYT